ncbi:Uncharacterised protein [Vibrio cholerae]|uniref:Uncharacterized protein n=1 Tax=Vibrio cholerae TaxID=666 RepID=A0A655Z6H0_VIBCL|nr:Uncharacterised protein [Vibrio cholerae]CSA56107.1 Uncharacterised protein [Vibrio cholerae]CSB41017.1 Uncharacterised protein [Vibrio cholerae]CSB47064.1 Uncharacterised protein [Vibrio cholerae]CSB54093.1 Uncharacterised protein [Vibrio cholerae]
MVSITLSSEIKHLLVRLSAMREALIAFTAPIALRSIQGTCTKPPIGSQVIPNECSIAISAAMQICSLLPPRKAVKPAAAMEEETPTSP